MRSSRLAVVLAASVIAIVPISGRDAGPQSAQADVQVQIADLLYAEGQYRDAMMAYRGAEQAQTATLRLRAKMGIVRCAQRTGDFGLSYDQAQQLRAMAPHSAEAIALYGESLWAVGLFDESEQAFAEALAADAREPRAHFGAARAAASRNRLDAALDEAQTGLRLAPKDAEMHFLLGKILARLGRYPEAADALSAHVKMLPERDREDRSVWSRAEIRLLRSFGNRVPFEIPRDQAARHHTMPFTLVDGKVIVRVKVNGRHEVDMAVDTGAEHTVLSQAAARRLRLSPVTYGVSAGVGEIGLRGLMVGRLDSLQVGTLMIRNVRCLVKTPALVGLPKAEPESFSPLALGLSMTVDYPRRMLTLGPGIDSPPADFDLPLRVDRLATVRGVVNEIHHGSFIVDTGGEVISISAQTADEIRPGNPYRRIPLRVWGVSGWDRSAYLLPGVQLAFDAIRYPNTPVVVLDLQAPSLLLGYRIGGILGHHFLNRYRVDFDLQQSRLRLTRS